jgi:hypothetical protein
VTIYSDEKPTVTVTAPDNTASESPLTTGYFRVTQSVATTAPLTVSFTVGGTATPGSDYASLGTSVTIPAGSTSKNVLVTPVNDTLVEGSETVILTVAEDPGYTRGSPSNATVTITSED